VHAAEDTICKSAITIFDAQLNADLATMDLTVTLPGALITLSLSLVALIAGYISRGELLHAFMRCSLPLWFAKACAFVITAFALITYPATVVIAEMAARSSNPTGDESTVRWMQAGAGEDGTYRVVAAISMTSTAEYNTAAFVIVWLTLALSAVLTSVICVSLLKFNLEDVRKHGELPAYETRPSEVKQLMHPLRMSGTSTGISAASNEPGGVECQHLGSTAALEEMEGDHHTSTGAPAM
jgi:hypothetical protein